MFRIRAQHFGLCIVVAIFARFSYALPCDFIFDPKLLKHPEVVALGVEFFASFDTQLLLGKQVPGWEDFDKLENFKRKVLSVQAALSPGEIKKEATAAVSIAETNEVKDFLLAKQTNTPDSPTKLKPTEAELKRSFQHKLIDLNRILPKPLRIPITRTGPNTHRQDLIKEGEAIVEKLSQEVESLFSTTGFASMDEYRKAVHAAGGDWEQTLKMLQQEDVGMCMRRPENARFWVPKVGFHNQRITGSSQGHLGPNTRDTAEAKYLGIQKESYVATNDDLKPKYGYMTRDPKSKFYSKDRRIADWFGTDQYFLKPAKLRSRTTYTLRDSLSYPPVTVQERQKNWGSRMIPWSYRELATPYMANTTESRFAPQPKMLPETLTAFKAEGQGNWGEYTELQFWGPVGLDDVETLVFQGTPPSGEFLHELQARNIKILDGRNSPAVEWTP